MAHINPRFAALLTDATLGTKQKERTCPLQTIAVAKVQCGHTLQAQPGRIKFTLMG
jgi:hypothetical protein